MDKTCTLSFSFNNISNFFCFLRNWG